MATVEESLPGQSPLAAALRAGVGAISANQVVVFTKYVRLVLPLDGAVFWVRADLVSGGALLNAARINGAAFNQPPHAVTDAPFAEAQGSLHFSTDLRQEETETYAVNRVVFTALQEVKDLNQVGPAVMFVAVVDGVKFAFSSRGSYYDQAKLWHYVGNAVYSDMDTQIVDSATGFSRALIVSNSLPIWLAFNGYVPTYGFGNPSLTLFPSYLVPANLPPPYAAVHIGPDTEALAAAPRIGLSSEHSQLVKDRVKITLYGVRNDEALDFVDCVNQRSVDHGEFGIMNMPVMRDEKRPQAELAAIGIKKSIEFEVSYYQRRMAEIARQIIVSSIPTFIVTAPIAA